MVFYGLESVVNFILMVVIIGVVSLVNFFLVYFSDIFIVNNYLFFKIKNIIRFIVFVCFGSCFFVVIICLFLLYLFEKIFFGLYFEIVYIWLLSDVFVFLIVIFFIIVCNYNFKVFIKLL